MKLNLCGPAYKLSSIDSNFQRCVNMFPIDAGPDGRGTPNSDTKKHTILIPTAGLSLLTDLGTAPIRGMKTFGSYTYVVCGFNIYRLAINHKTQDVSSLLIGTIASEFSTVYMAANPTQVIFVDGSNLGYLYTPGTGVFQTINTTDADFPGGTQVAFSHGYFVVNQPNTGKFFFSALNDGLSWDPLDVATAESSTDLIVGLGISKGELWVVGENSTEIWYDAANPTGAPFSPRVGLEIQIGCGAPDSIVEFNDLLIWLDNRGYIVQSQVSPFIRSNNSGYDLKIISDQALTTEILSYSDRSDAIATAYNDRGHLMYQITFPSAKKTWVFDYTTDSWHEREYYDGSVDKLQYHLCQFYAASGSLHIMSGIRDGKVYLSSSDYYTDNGVPIRRKRISPVFTDADEFREVGIDKLEIRVGLVNIPLNDAQITVRYSIDGGHTWGHHMPRSISYNGTFAGPIQWNRLGNGREWIFEITLTEDMPFSIVDSIVKISELEQ